MKAGWNEIVMRRGLSSVRSYAVGASVIVLALTSGYSIGHATSPFPSGKPAPQIFSGYLTSNGAPLDGAHAVGVNLWRSADTSSTGNLVCEGPTQSTAVANGNFRITLDDSCADALTRYTQVWYELVVDGTHFPLQQIGAVPFAARSLQEAASGSRLKLIRTVDYGEDGYRSQASTTIFDTARNEQCWKTPTMENGIAKLRCLPDYLELQPPPSWAFTDAACTSPMTERYFSYNSATIKYAAEVSDSSSPVTQFSSMTGTTPISLYILQIGGCTRVDAWLPAGMTGVPLTSFVAIQRVTEQ